MDLIKECEKGNVQVFKSADGDLQKEIYNIRLFLLIKAAICGKTEIIDVLVKKYHVNLSNDIESDVAVSMAISFGRLDVLEHIEKVHNYDFKSRANKLYITTTAYKQFEIFKFLEEKACDPSPFKEKLLLKASEVGAVEIAKYLIEKYYTLTQIKDMNNAHILASINGNNDELTQYYITNNLFTLDIPVVMACIRKNKEKFLNFFFTNYQLPQNLLLEHKDIETIVNFEKTQLAINLLQRSSTRIMKLPKSIREDMLVAILNETDYDVSDAIINSSQEKLKNIVPHLTNIGTEKLLKIMLATIEKIDVHTQEIIDSLLIKVHKARMNDIIL